MFGWLRNMFRGSPPAARQGDVRRAHVDAAKTTDENRNHWAEADPLAPVSQLTPEIRRTLYMRSRYECQNNCYAGGLVRTLVNDTVGRGARLQMLTPDAALNEGVEDLWRVWSAATNWPLSSRLIAGTRYVAGECFGIFRDSKRLARLGLPVTLDLRLIEPDQVHDPFAEYLYRSTGDDGILCDEEGEIVSYQVLKAHPGDLRMYAARWEVDVIPARDVVHWFVPDRVGQLRGTTPIAPALPIFAQLRRFTSATLTAAEFAAMLAGTLELPEQPLADSQATSYATMDTVEMVRGMLLTVPNGAKATQFRPEQPTTNYDMFVGAKLRECGRCLSVPYGKMAGDHSRYNYSSGRMDDAPYWSDRDIERQALEVSVFDPVLYRWLDFARFALPSLAAYQGQWWQLKHQWHYDARPVTDPVKDATGDSLNLTNATDTLDAIAEREGTTVEALLDGRARVRDMFVERGLSLPAWLAPTAPAGPTGPGGKDKEDGQDDNTVEREEMAYA